MNAATQVRYQVWPWVVYPLTMLVALCLFPLLRAQGLHLLACTYVPVFFGAATITFFELYTPHQRSWIAAREDVWNDALFMVTVQMILPKILTFLVAVTLLRLLGHFELQAQALWPHQWNVGLQVVLMILVADFLRYWLHRLAHNNKTLWKLHAVHHSPQKLYWVNVGRFHPIEKALQFLADATPFIAVGVGEEVLALYFVFYAVNGFFQHCNVELQMGPLNYLISGPQLHRWHHSRKPGESNNNYGNNIIVWDLLFGTYFYPKDRLVGELGLLNREYPLGYGAQLKAPFAGNIDRQTLPLLSFRQVVLNFLLGFKMRWIERNFYRPLVEAAKNPGPVQERVLRAILDANKDAEFGRKYGFERIEDHAAYAAAVPVHEYEDLRPYIERQERDKVPVLTVERPFMYNQTSGTTGQPKYIPVLQRTMEALRRSQQTFSLVQYRGRREGFHGRILGLVSPAVSGHLETGTPYGSASGHIYRNMPRLTQAKYALPPEVFAVEDYDIKYYLIARLAIEHEDLTYIGSANPSTFHRLLETIKSRRDDLVEDLERGTCRHLEELEESAARAIGRRLGTHPERAAKLRRLFASGEALRYADFWPYLKVLTTWTGGSCGIALKSILPSFPAEIQVIELGYLSSEARLTITIDAQTNEGIPTLEENFFEFVEKGDWEEGGRHFLTLERLEEGREYYVFLTTPAGLYRYHMNDIVRVSGRFENTPTLQFVQKGKGITSITGEKLYESQVVAALKGAEEALRFSPRFYQMLADEENPGYELYIELDPGAMVDVERLSAYVDEALQKLNVEYEAKRASGRLRRARAHLLRPGTFEVYKRHCLAKGQREGQFKSILLQYGKNFDFDLASCRAPA